MSEALKGTPTSIRFADEEDRLLTILSYETGLKKSDLIRRALKMLLQENARRPNPGWIIVELGPRPANVTSYPTREEVAERAAEDAPRPPGKRRAS